MPVESGGPMQNLRVTSTEWR